jgi:DNA-binding response OmpR family regulator
MAKILIAEDEPLISSFLEKGLRGSGFSTLVTADGEEAEELSLTGEFDLLILDMGLPRRDGFDVLKRIRAHGSRLPVLVITGRTELRDELAYLEAGADGYMTKPFSFSDLLARVRSCLRPGVQERRPDQVLPERRRASSRRQSTPSVSPAGRPRPAASPLTQTRARLVRPYALIVALGLTCLMIWAGIVLLLVMLL